MRQNKARQRRALFLMSKSGYAKEDWVIDRYRGENKYVRLIRLLR